MEKRDKFEFMLKAVIVCLLTIIIILFILFATGNIEFTKNNDEEKINSQTSVLESEDLSKTQQAVNKDNTTSSTTEGNETTASFDPYANYKQIGFSQRTRYVNDNSDDSVRYTDISVTSSNILTMEYKEAYTSNILTKTISIPSNEKIKCFEYVVARSGDGGLETIVILSQEGNLYYVTSYSKIYSDDNLVANKIDSTIKVLEIHNKEKGTPEGTTTGIDALLNDGNLYRIAYQGVSTIDRTCILVNE